jgi:competence protein ComEC
VIGGILFGQALPGDWRVSLAASALCATLWLVARWRRARYAHWVAATALFFWLGAARTQYWDSTPRPSVNAEPNELVAAEACVVSFPEQRQDRLVFWAELAPGARMRVTSYGSEHKTKIQYGQRLSLHARLKSVRNSGNPGSFDAERYLRHRDIFWHATLAAGYPVEILPGSCGQQWQAQAYAWRGRLLARIAEVAGGDVYLRAMLGALLLGENSGIEKAWTENYRRSGTYHAIVVSGLHVTLLAGTLAWLLRTLFVPMRTTVMLCSILAVAYALLCDLSAPVVRAAGGFVLYSIGKLFYRRARTLNLLAAVTIVFLLLDPEQLFEGSFLLSFLAVFALGALARPIEERFFEPWREAVRDLEDSRIRLENPAYGDLRLELRLAGEALSKLFRLDGQLVYVAIRWLTRAALATASLVLTSAIVLIGLSLPTVLFFHRLNFVSLSANLPVVVLLSAGVVAGFAGLAVGPASAPLLSGLLDLSRRTVDWHLQWDSGIRVPDPPAWLMLTFLACLILCALLAGSRPRLALAPAFSALACFAYLAIHPYERQPLLAAGKLELTAVDIGQGDALFLATPSGHLALLDGGGSRSDAFDPGEAVLSPYLWSRRIGHVHTLIASHGDLDHLGGLLAAYDNFRPREVWVSPLIRGDLWEKLKAKAGDRIRYLAAGDRVNLGETPVEVLWPPRDAEIKATNLSSLVLLLRHGQHRFLLTGDIDASVESEILARGGLGKVDVLKVAHHGSRTGTGEDFLAATQPAFALISAGWANQFGHPHPKVLERLEASKALVLRTDQLGQIRLLSDGRRFQTESYVYRERPWWGRIPLATALE